MARYFPRDNVAWHLEEPRVIRKLTLSLPAMAVIAGLLVRLIRVGVSGITVSWWGVFGAIALGLIVLLTTATAHLGNYPVKQWLWRAPLFGLAEGAAEAGVSALLTVIGVERLGSTRAHLSDWPSMATDTIVGTPGLAFLDGRIVMVSLFALVLAGVVQVVRYLLLRSENRDHTAVAIHEEHERQEQAASHHAD
ncbi:MAG TPA: hypothetical protein VJ802_06315 [Gemmatimonadaceae bacterium]|nr:hypothetical protein [Gemmatimonadaceae bacterium]